MDETRAFDRLICYGRPLLSLDLQRELEINDSIHVFWPKRKKMWQTELYCLFSTLKGTRSNHGLRWSPSAEMKGRDGHSFAYILHYLGTGDLIYPLHEGFHRVDVLLKASIIYLANRIGERQMQAI